MSSIDKKNWCIMIYANGNNDLEPEMWQVKELAESIGSDENVDVVLQLGREDRELVNIFRPDNVIPEPKESWTGVRRYYLLQNQSLIIEELGNINMADPVTLYEFMRWTMSYFPAHQYMLILGGHGYQFVGCMTDYSQDQPYIMGIPGMNKAIEMACNELGCKISLLILDICYFNFIEVMYEMGQSESPAVLNTLTYILNGSVTGLPVDFIIKLLQQNPYQSVIQVIKEIINRMHFIDLVAFEINHSKLKEIKLGFHQLAHTYLTKGDKEQSMYELLQCSNPDLPWYDIAREIIYNMFSLIIHHQRTTNSHQSLINVANNPNSDKDKIALYSKLAFAKENDWTYLLSSKIDIPKQAQVNEMEPVVLKQDALYAYVSTMNPYKSVEEKRTIFNTLFWYKGWSLK